MATHHPLVWLGMDHAPTDPTPVNIQFLRTQDHLTAVQRHLPSPFDVLMAHSQGNSEDTHDIQLVFIRPGGQGAYSGNAAFILMHENRAAGWKDVHMVFAATPEAGKALKNGITATCHYIPMLMVRPSSKILSADVTARSGTGNDVTSFMASQAGWTGDYGPPSTAAVEPLAPYQHRDAATVRVLWNRNGSPTLGARGQQLRDFDHILPRQISTEVTLADNSFLIGYWMVEDPRITYDDIIDRMIPTNNQFIKKRNVINQSVSRWRKGNNIMASKNNGGVNRTDGKAIEGLSIAQLDANCNWTLDATGTWMRRPNDVEPYAWYPAPPLHPDSASFNPNHQQSGLRFTPRVRKARLAIATQSSQPTLSSAAPPSNAPMATQPSASLLPPNTSASAHLTTPFGFGIAQTTGALASRPRNIPPNAQPNPMPPTSSMSRPLVRASNDSSSSNTTIWKRKATDAFPMDDSMPAKKRNTASTSAVFDTQQPAPNSLQTYSFTNPDHTLSDSAHSQRFTLPNDVPSYDPSSSLDANTLDLPTFGQMF